MRRVLYAGLVLGLALGGLAVAVAPTPAAASVVMAMSLEELTQRADVIVVAVPTEQQSRRHIDGKMIVTDVSLKVDTLLKGDAKLNANLVATVLGGELGDLAMQAPGEATFNLGQRVIVFLYRAKTSGDLRVLGMSQGVMPLIQRAKTTMVLPAGGDAALMQRDADGTMREGQAALDQPIAVGELLERIRSLVAKQKK